MGESRLTYPPDFDPLLYLGLDIGVRRDTCALVAVFRDYQRDVIALWGHRLWIPPVKLAEHVHPFVLHLLRTNRVALLAFDPYQFEYMKNDLEVEGHGSRLREVNQGTEMIAATASLHEVMTSGRLLIYDDPDVRSQMSWTAVKETERGPRIVKMRQSKRIDVVVALAMAIYAAQSESGYGKHPAYAAQTHTPHAAALP